MAEFEGESPNKDEITGLGRGNLVPFPRRAFESPTDPVSSITITHFGAGMPIEVEQFAVDALVDAMGDQGKMIYPRKVGDGHVIPLRILQGGIDAEKGE